MNLLIHKILIVLISIVTLFIFLLPFVYVFYVGDKEQWKSLFLVEDWTSLMFYLPFAILWSIYLIRQGKTNSLLFKISIVITALITFIESLLSTIAIAQDYEPYIGAFLSLLIFPLVVIFFLNQRALSHAN